ncbi:MAG TPA: hypothetical protein VGB45_11145 [Abditibacterium sp.]
MSKLVCAPDETKLRALIERGLSVAQIAGELGVSPVNVRRWLKKFGLEVQAVRQFFCATCGQTDPTKFTSHKPICIACFQMLQTKKRGDARQRALEYLGAKCQKCGFDTFEVALDVHQIDPTIKDPNFHAMKGWTWDEIERELQGGVVLCKNCHAAVHAGLIFVD